MASDVPDFVINANRARVWASRGKLADLSPVRLTRQGTSRDISGHLRKEASENWLRPDFGEQITVSLAFLLADRGRIVALVLRGTLLQLLIGLAIGIPILLFGGRFAASQLFEVRFYDPISIVLATVVLSAAAALAGSIPA